jgi:hypothetical protein
MSVERKIHNKKVETTMAFVNALAIGSCIGAILKPLIDTAGGARFGFSAMHAGLLILGVALHILASSGEDDG